MRNVIVVGVVVFSCGSDLIMKNNIRPTAYLNGSTYNNAVFEDFHDPFTKVSLGVFKAPFGYLFLLPKTMVV